MLRVCASVLGGGDIGVCLPDRCEYRSQPRIVSVSYAFAIGYVGDKCKASEAYAKLGPPPTLIRGPLNVTKKIDANLICINHILTRSVHSIVLTVNYANKLQTHINSFCKSVRIYDKNRKSLKLNFC